MSDFEQKINSSSVKVDAIFADIDFGKLSVVKGSGNEIEIVAKNVPKTFKAEVSNNTLKIAFNLNFFSLENMKHNLLSPFARTSIMLYLPNDIYKELKVELDAGECRISDFECGNIELNVKACKIKVSNIRCDKLDAKNKAGTIKIKDLMCKGMLTVGTDAGDVSISDTETGGLIAFNQVGKVSFDGSVNGDIDIQCKVGDATLNLNNSEGDFFGDSKKYSMSIDCAVGKKKVTYNEK